MIYNENFLQNVVYGRSSQVRSLILYNYDFVVNNPRNNVYIHLFIIYKKVRRSIASFLFY
jgi:hypothetical protein